jgi:hypothetical protein
MPSPSPPLNASAPCLKLNQYGAGKEDFGIPNERKARIHWYTKAPDFMKSVRWLKLDIAKVQTKGVFLDQVDLSKVDEVGFMDLTPGSGHGPGHSH